MLTGPRSLRARKILLQFYVLCLEHNKTISKRVGLSQYFIPPPPHDTRRCNADLQEALPCSVASRGTGQWRPDFNHIRDATVMGKYFLNSRLPGSCHPHSYVMQSQYSTKKEPYANLIT
jgi:hypothetical protein